MDNLPSRYHVLRPAHRRQRRCSPRFVTEQCEQTALRHAPQVWSESKPYPSTSMASPELEPSPVPQSSQLAGDGASAIGDAVGTCRGPELMFQKLCSDRWVGRDGRGACSSSVGGLAAESGGDGADGWACAL